MNEWIKDLQVGDEVSRTVGGWRTSYEIGKVCKVTKHQLVVAWAGQECRYRRADGWAVGAKHHLHRATQEVRDAIERSALEHWLWTLYDRVRCGKRVPLDALRAMHEAYRSAAQDSQENESEA